MSTHQKIFMGLYIVIFSILPVSFFFWLDYTNMGTAVSGSELFVSIMAHLALYPLLSGLGAYCLYYQLKTPYIIGRTAWPLFITSLLILVTIVWKVYLFFAFTFEYHSLEQDNLYVLFYSVEFFLSMFTVVVISGRR
jgi:hypothetical protein